MNLPEYNKSLKEKAKLDPHYKERSLAKPMSYELKGSIDPKRYVDPAIIAGKYMTDPKFRDAVNLMSKIEGHEKWVQGAHRAAVKKVKEIDIHAKNQKIAIDRAIYAKKEGMI